MMKMIIVIWFMFFWLLFISYRFVGYTGARIRVGPKFLVRLDKGM